MLITKKTFLKKVEQKCATNTKNVEQFKSTPSQSNFYLNRLESYLLKLVIPFLRIAYCPRSNYFKVKGDLILISANICKSLSKILPLHQNLIPVRFKRRLAYTGSFIEEFVEKEKVQMYFDWLKQNNHLYKDLDLDLSLVDEFLNESESSAKTVESDYDHVSSENGEYESDNSVSAILESQFEGYSKPEEENNRFSDQTTIFMDKYCEDPNLPTVANKLASMIVDYEISRKIKIDDLSDFELDDEEVNDEEFLRLVDAELDFPEKGHRKSNETPKNTDSDGLFELCISTNQEYKLRSKAGKEAIKIREKMKKIDVAPGEFGDFKNWGEDVFLEEKAFPEKFPYGTGGYLSSCIVNPENDIGFANYCINQIMSADPKFRNDCTYLFFILLVKELIHLKRCKSTYMRQVSRLPDLNKTNILTLDKANLSRFNRTFQVFKSMRGTTMYFEEAKRNVMATLRQNGCPTLFLTLSCAEFDWEELLKEVIETVERRTVSADYVANLSKSEKNRIISTNVVQTTLHFNKRIEKFFHLIQGDFFVGGRDSYHVSSYFYRIEFQQRGSAHVHALLWLRNQNDEEAPSYWYDKDTKSNDSCDKEERARKKIENFADFLISTSPEDMTCFSHTLTKKVNCTECNQLKEKVQQFQSHSHTFSCRKKRKVITIREFEGHGRLDGISHGAALVRVPICRYKFPKFPLDETKLIKGIPKDADEDQVKEMKGDLSKIIKYLIRQTYTNKKLEDLQSWKNLRSLDFYEFLYEVGMFKKQTFFEYLTEEDKKEAKKRYLNAIAVSIQGSAIVILKREVKDIFVNGFNKIIMRLHKANHDLQICIDLYAVAQYVCGYLTKNESGISKLLKAIDEASKNLSQMERLNALASVLDKSREVSIQEAIYRLLGLCMTKSSVKVKYLSTIHPNFRDGLLKGNISELDDSESIFHTSAHEYYENRPLESNEDDVEYDQDELVNDYWEKLSLAEFWSSYEIIYDKSAKKRCKKNSKTKIQVLLNNKGYIRKRSQMAILRYYLNHNNDEDLARGLLILFMPFRNEHQEIHQKDVKELLHQNRENIEEKRSLFEKYKVLTDLISEIQPDEINEEENSDNEDEKETFEDMESTSLTDVDQFDRWAKSQAHKDLTSV